MGGEDDEELFSRLERKKKSLNFKRGWKKHFS
jgi:hypothetical protein